MTRARALALLMFVVFMATSFLRGWTRHETDFPNYYTAAVLVLQRAPLRCYYDWTWFQKQMILAGNRRQLGGYLPQTPLAMLPIVPIARFPVQTAKQIWLALNLLLLAATLWMLSKNTRIPIEYLAILLFFGYGSLQSNFRLGQYYVFLLFLLTLAFYCLESGKFVTSGFLCGVAFGLKLYGGPFLLYFMVKRNWKAVAGMLAGSGVALATAIALFGWGDVQFYGTQILPRSLEGEVIDPYDALNGTLTTLLRHSFVLEPNLNPHPLLNAPAAFFFLRTFVALLILGYTLFGLAAEGRFSRRGFAWFTIAVLLLSSNAASYTYILLLLPVALLLPLLGPRERVFLIVSYVALNFYVRPSLVPFFPKLCLVAVLYCVEGRHYWKAFRPKIIAAGLSAAVIIAGFDAQRHLKLYRLEPTRYLQRLAVDRGTYFSTYPVVTSAGLFYQAMVPHGYVLRWSHDGQVEEFSFDGMAFHPQSPSLAGPVYFELVKDRASTTMVFDPVTRQAAPAPNPAMSDSGNRSVTSPDGKWTAFESTQTGPKQIWLKDNVSGRSGALTRGNCNNSSPAWQASDRLTFASDCDRGLGMPVLYYAHVPQDIHFH